MSAEELDDVMAGVVASAAQRIRSAPQTQTLLERFIEEALMEAWHELVPGGVARRTVSLVVPDWEPQPAQTDFAAGMPEAEFPTILAEVKVDALDQTLWDVFKALSVADHAPGVERVYMVAAGYPSRWTSVQCSQLYAREPVTQTWSAHSMFRDWEKAWINLLGGGRARPKRVHAEIRTRFVWGGPVAAFSDRGYELRCVAVEPVAEAGWLRFEGDWPAPTPAEKRIWGDDDGDVVVDPLSLSQAQLTSIAQGRRQEERARVEQLEGEVAAWVQAERIRRYVTALRESDLPEAQRARIAAWAAWAELHADSLDPLQHPEQIGSQLPH